MPEFTVFKGSDSGAIVTGKSTREIGNDEVLVRVTHSGLCGTDLHYKTVDMALGHEGVGVVEEVGKDVKLFKKGERAGWGYNHSSCGHCKACQQGNDIYCPERKLYGMADLDQGSLSSHAVWKETHLFKIPEKMDSRDAAPLQCGGITVYEALQGHGSPVKAGDRIGIIGVGGLGHLAIQFAAKMGAEVVVFSGTDSKKDEAIKLGAKEFWAMKDRKDGFKEGEIKPIDRLVVTASKQIDWKTYFSIMSPQGIIVPLSVDEGDLSVPYMPLLVNGIRIQGSVVGSKQIHQDMLNFAAVQDIRPIIQEFPLTEKGVNEAVKTLEEGNMRYRGVLVA